MFLHENTRRTLCRLSFLLCCTAPTLAVAAWILWLHSAWYVQSVERRAEVFAGLQVSIDRIAQPRRGQARWHDVTMYDSATGQLLAKAGQVELNETAQGLGIRVVDGWVDASIGSAIRDRVVKRLALADSEVSNVWISTPELVWHCSDREYRLKEVKAGVEANDQASQAYLTFRPTSAERGPWMRLSKRHDSSAAWQVECQTYQYSVPICWFQAFGVNLSRLGPAAEFGGHFTSQWFAGEWNTLAAGRVSQIDLARLLGNGTSHELTGTAQLQTEPNAPLRLRGQRFERLSATLTAGPGEVSSSLLQSLSQHLEMRSAPTASPRTTSAKHAYQQLALRVLLEPQGIIIQGRCDAKGNVMTDGSGPLVSQPPRAKTVASLVAALSAPSPAVIPATAEAQRLATYLPAIEAQPRLGARTPAPGQGTK